MYRETELEIARYNISHIEEASKDLIANLAAYSNIEGTDEWTMALVGLHYNFRREKPKDWSLRAKGLELSFSGFPEPIPTIEDDKVVLKAREPRFVFEEFYNELRPHERTHLSRFTQEVAMEMGEVYDLEVDNYPTTLIFPKEKYADVERVRAVML